MEQRQGKPQWELVVGNIGSVCCGTNGFEANARYQTYVGHSKDNYGRAAGESVTLFRNGEIFKEHFGTVGQIESDDSGVR